MNTLVWIPGLFWLVFFGPLEHMPDKVVPLHGFWSATQILVIASILAWLKAA
jgi:hypothetical protein